MRQFAFRSTVIFYFFYGYSAFSQINHWENLVSYNQNWRYFTGTSEPDTNWAKITFNDAAWSQGPGGIGRGDGDDNTIIPVVPSVYYRRTFNVLDTSLIEEALFSIDYDDGFIAYLNNVEIARSNLGQLEGDRPPFNTYANGQHEALIYQGGLPETFIIPKFKLNQCMVNGPNVLAVTVHNANGASNDMSSATWLDVGISVPGNFYNPVANWFVPPIESSDLPLVWINTHGQTVVDTPRIGADMGIIYNGPGLRNYLSDPFNNYDGRITIEVRGSSSQMFPKLGYGLETVDSLGLNNNVSILGMPKENDWVLYAPYTDKAMMRNTLAYDLARKMGHYTTRTRFCEVIVNGNYKGVYEFHEKIKADKNRVAIEVADSNDFAGDSLTGGYIFKLDKETGTGGYAWDSPYNSNVHFSFHDPEDLELAPVQKQYLENFVTAFEDSLFNPSFSISSERYKEVIDVASWIDFFIVNEVSHNVDGYRLSSYFTKQKESLGGKIFALPLWDFNLGFGNADYCNGGDSFGWAYQFNQVCSGNNEVPFWWDMLMTSPGWRDELRCRWDFLRQGPLHTDTLMNWIDSISNVLAESQVRNYQRWPILGTYVWPNNFVGNTYSEEVGYLKMWLQNRMQWLDMNLPAAPSACGTPGASDVVVSEVNYHSASSLDAGDWVELFNNGTSSVDLSGWIFKDENELNTFTIPDGTVLPPGGYFVLAQDTALFHSRHPNVSNVGGPFTFSLSNGGGEFRLYDEDYFWVNSIRYDDSLPWPLLADGGGYTLDLNQPGLDPNDGNNWSIVCPEGSPGGPWVLNCFIASAADPDGEKTFQVFPNPFEQELTIRFNAPMPNATARVLLRDMTGKLVQETTVYTQGEVRLHTDDLAPGVYFLELHADQQLLGARKLVKI